MDNNNPILGSNTPTQDAPAPATEPTPAPAPEQTTEPTPTAEPTPTLNNATKPVAPAATPVAAPAKKSKKPLIFALIGILVAGALATVAIIIFANMSDPNSPKAVAKSYVENLIAKKYSDNHDKLLYLPENSFVSTDDYIDFVGKKDDYAGISDYKIKEVKESSISNQTANYDVSIEKDDSSSERSIKLKLTKSSSWKVDEGSFYLSNWSMAVPGGTKLYIDGAEVPESLIKEDSSINKHYVKYEIPAIYSSKKSFKLSHQYGEKAFEQTPISSDSDKEYDIELTNKELLTKAQNYIKDTWNAIYKDFVAGKDVSDVAAAYFDSSNTVEDVNEYYTKAMSALQRSSTKNYNYVNYNMTEVVSGKDSSFVIDKDVITINFGYRLTWVWEFMPNTVEDMTRYSKIRLKIDGDSFKIIEVPDTKLFNWSNSFTHEYK